MPNFSEPNLAEVLVADVDAPAVMTYVTAPQLNPDQTAIEFVMKCPTNDAKNNGTAPLTGLHTAYACKGTIVNGVLPFANLTSAEILASPLSTVLTLTAAEGVAPGADLTVSFPNTNDGAGSYQIAIFCHDGAA